VCATTCPMGAGKWKREYSEWLSGASVVFVVADRDDEGRKHTRQVAASVRKYGCPIVRVLEPAVGKDLADHLNAGRGLDELVLVGDDGEEPDAADRALPAYDEPEIGASSTTPETPATAPPPPTEPPTLARNPQILHAFRRDVRRRGVVGEVATACTTYLIVTSRVLDRQVSAAVKGDSSSGKSHTVERVVDFFPDDAVIAMTAMSEHALVYMPEDLRHRTLVLFEAAALREGQEENHTAYFVRSLLSEGRIRYPAVIRDKASGEFVTRWIIKEGPTNLLVTTTKTRVHAENETRLLSFSTDDSKDQTRAVMAELAAESGDDGVDLAEWRQLQAWLAAAEHRVTIPYGGRLADLVPPVAVRLRRDFGAVLALIRAHAVLHQLSRDRDDGGRVVAVLEDYAVVRDLVGDVLAEGVGSTVSDTIRETVEAVERLAKAYEHGVPAAAVAKALDLDKSAARRRLLAAGDRDFVVNEEDRRGRPGRWLPAERLPETVVLLPEPDEVAVPPHPPKPPPSPPETTAPLYEFDSARLSGRCASGSSRWPASGSCASSGTSKEPDALPPVGVSRPEDPAVRRDHFVTGAPGAVAVQGIAGVNLTARHVHSLRPGWLGVGHSWVRGMVAGRSATVLASSATRRVEGRARGVTCSWSTRPRPEPGSRSQ
jgi:hypothetical protein